NGAVVVDQEVPLMPDEGIIAFQQHGRMPAREVTFRNLELTELTRPGPEGAFVPLFNGKDLSGWWVYAGGAGRWRALGGEIVSAGPESYLYTVRGDYEDFHLRAEVMINDGGNSGLHFRADFEPGPPPGYEAQ